MTDLIGPKPEPAGYRLAPNRIDIVYPTRRKAEATLATLQAHSHPDYEHSEVVEDTAPGPKHPTPWYTFGTEVRDGDCRTVLYADSPELAEAIVEAVNAHYDGKGWVAWRDACKLADQRAAELERSNKKLRLDLETANMHVDYWHKTASLWREEIGRLTNTIINDDRDAKRSAAHSALADAITDFDKIIDRGSSRKPRVFDGSTEPPADVKKLRSDDGGILERHPNGGWHWTSVPGENDPGLPPDALGYPWLGLENLADYEPFTEIIEEGQ